MNKIVIYIIMLFQICFSYAEDTKPDLFKSKDIDTDFVSRAWETAVQNSRKATYNRAEIARDGAQKIYALLHKDTDEESLLILQYEQVQFFGDTYRICQYDKRKKLTKEGRIVCMDNYNPYGLIDVQDNKTMEKENCIVFLKPSKILDVKKLELTFFRGEVYEHTTDPRAHKGCVINVKWKPYKNIGNRNNKLGNQWASKSMEEIRWLWAEPVNPRVPVIIGSRFKQ